MAGAGAANGPVHTPVSTNEGVDGQARARVSDAEAGSDERQRQRQLASYQATMRGCRRCVEAGDIPEAFPVFQGHVGQRIMVVGQAPAARTSEHPKPYSGASGVTLRRWFERAGFPPDSLHERCYLTSLTKCFPGSSTSGKGDRAPSAAEIARCRPHLARELSLVQPEVVLALGRLAAAAFAGNQPLSAMVGNVFTSPMAPGAAIIPLPHPSGVSRWLNEPEHQALLAQALAALDTLRRERGL